MRALPVFAVLLAMAVHTSAEADAQTPPTTTSIFLGGVPSGTRTDTSLTISIQEAMTRALAHNLGVLTAEAEVEHAQGRRRRELSALLPNVSGRVSETRQQINLQAFGFGGFGDAFAGVPTVVGPFNVFDARVYVSQAVVDVGATENARAEAHNVRAAQHMYEGSRDFVVWVTGNLYLQALAASARVDSARAQRDTAQALYTQAVDLKIAGLVAGIDVLRSQVQLNVETNRATTAANDFEKAKLQLARVMGLPLGQAFALDDVLPELAAPDLTVEQAVTRAYDTRADYLAALDRVRAAESARASVLGDRLPSLRLNADFGDIGLSPTDAHSTFSVSGAVQVPLYQGGRIHGRLLEADADLRKRRSEVEDLKAAIYYDVRTAFLDLQATGDELRVAATARDLAAQQLAQSRDRFAAGIASNIEVVQAQEAVAVANEQYTAARYGYGLAKGALFRGMGTAEAILRQTLGGTR